MTNVHQGRSIWTTADGRKLKPEEMSDDHLQNTINYLKRNLPELKAQIAINLYAFPCFQGEMAQFCAEAEWDSNIGRAQVRLENAVAWIKVFELEQTNRRRLAQYEKVKAVKEAMQAKKSDNLTKIHDDLIVIGNSLRINSVRINRQFIFDIVDRLEGIAGK